MGWDDDAATSATAPRPQPPVARAAPPAPKLPTNPPAPPQLTRQEQQPFIMVLITQWQRKMLIKFGGTIIMDSTHGTNQHGYSLFTVMVIDDYGTGLPAAWFITSNEQTATIARALTKLKDAVTEWKPKTFVVDDADAEIGAINETFPGCNILLCLWHVKRCWIKHLIWKVTGGAAMSAQLRANLMDDLNRLVAFNPAEGITDEQIAKSTDVTLKFFFDKYENVAGRALPVPFFIELF
jgi:hypothetical protein